MDTSLALSRYGLLLAQRLSEEFNVWLVRELWQILDNTQYYLSHPEILLSKSAGALNVERSDNMVGELINETLNQWELARIHTDMAGLNVFWIGDAIRESLLPQGIDQALINRFEILAGSLDEKINRDDEKDFGNVLTDCYRDAAALTAALMPYKSFILALQGAGNEASTKNEPGICSYLREIGIQPCRIDAGNKIKIERGFLDPILGRAGISELIWAGLDLAVVHIVVPQAIVMPRIDNDDGDFAECIAGEGKEQLRKDWWGGAVCFWYSI
jgi:hypothetical protein